MSLVMMIGWVVLLGLAGLGWLRVAGVQRVYDGLTTAVLAYWAGFVWVGVATMALGYAGHLTLPWLLPLAAPALLGAWALPGLAGSGRGNLWPLLALLVLACISLPGALVPPTEGDSLAYHFVLPKLYAAAEGLVFAPVAVTFASPQLTHMLSTAAYITGGEKLMILHAWSSVLMAGLATFALARRYLPVWGSVAVAAVFLTTPCVTYGFDAGTVELRQAGLFAAFALMFVAYADTRRLGALLVAVALLGANPASKFFALFLLPGTGLALLWLWRRDWWQVLRHGMPAALVLALVAAPWYVSNWVQYGDPMFPALAVKLGSPYWSGAMQEVMTRVYFSTELMIPRTLETMFTYPVIATLAGAVMDSDRTGMGPFLPLSMLAGFGLAGYALWLRRKGQPLPPRFEALLLLLGIGLVYYLLWFFLGISGRSRHLLPVWPVWLVAGGVVVRALWPTLPRVARGGVVAAVVVTVAVQAAMAALLNLPAAKVVAGRVGEEDYLAVAANSYPAAQMANAHLGAGDRLLVVSLRNVMYYLDIPAFHNHYEYTAVVPFATGGLDTVWRALRRGGFTAWLAYGDPDAPGAVDDGRPVLKQLLTLGCAMPVAAVTDYVRASRTLAAFKPEERVYRLYRLTPESCALERPVSSTGGPTGVSTSGMQTLTTDTNRKPE